MTSITLDQGEVGLFGYGSLLLKSSMEQTLARPYTKLRYACDLRGWSRCWNLLYPNKDFYFLKNSGEHCYPRNIVYLNMYRSNRAMNGVLYVISEPELAGFDRREWPYDRVDVSQDLVDLSVNGPVWGYTARPEHTLAAPAPAEQTAIRRSYVQIVERGLEEFGAAFRDRYFASTDSMPEDMVIDDQRD